MKIIGNLFFFGIFFSLFTLIGLAASSYLYQYLLFEHVVTWDITTAFRFIEFEFPSKGFLFGVLSMFVLIFLILMPIVMIFATFFLKEKQSLHGDARFANAKELEEYVYQGPYRDSNS